MNLIRETSVSINAVKKHIHKCIEFYFDMHHNNV